MTMGGAVKATSVQGDFTLLELNRAPPAGSVFMGWSNAEIADTSDVALHRVHHPSGAPQSYTTHVTDNEFVTCGGLPIPQFIYSTDTSGSTGVVDSLICGIGEAFPTEFEMIEKS